MLLRRVSSSNASTRSGTSSSGSLPKILKSTHAGAHSIPSHPSAYIDGADTASHRALKALERIALPESVLVGLSASLDLTLLKPYLCGHFKEQLVDSLDDYYNVDSCLPTAVHAMWLGRWTQKPSILVFPAVMYVQRQRAPCCAAASLASAVSAVARQKCYMTTEDVLQTMIGFFQCSEHEDLIQMALDLLLRKSLDPTKEERRAAIAEFESKLLELNLPAGVTTLLDPSPSTCLTNDLQPTVDLLTLPTVPPERHLEDEIPQTGRYAPAERVLSKVQRDISCTALLRLPRPSTARIGFAAMQRVINNHPHLGVAATLQKATTFQELIVMLTRPFTAVIIHLPNHYALVFGVHHESEGVLTARKGQLPRDWVPWADIAARQSKMRCGMFLVISKRI